MNVTAEATAPYGEWSGSATAWWGAARSEDPAERTLKSGHSLGGPYQGLH